MGGWIPFKEKVAERLEIKVDKNLKNEGGQPLVAGFHFRLGGAGMYPTFLSPKEDFKDDDLFTATGIMRYDETDKVYRIATKGSDLPISQPDQTSAPAIASADSVKTAVVAATDSVASPGSAVQADSTAQAEIAIAAPVEDVENAFTFNDARGLMTYKGKLNLMNTAPNEFLLSSGSARINIDSSLYRFNTFLAFAFPVPEPINALISDKLVKTNLEEQNSDAADDDLNRLSDKLVPLIGQQAVDAYRIKSPEPARGSQPGLAKTERDAGNGQRQSALVGQV